MGNWKLTSVRVTSPRNKGPSTPVVCTRSVLEGNVRLRGPISGERVAKHEDALTFGAKPSCNALQLIMVDDSTPYRVLDISELTRLIASHLTLINRKSVVNFACACRCLEEPVLSTLWKAQRSLFTLLKTLPRNTWCYEYTGSHGRVVRGPYLRLGRIQSSILWSFQLRIMEDPPPEAWSRLQRYASWMHHLHVDERLVLGEETFRKLRVNSPPGGWFPALQDLSWCITRSTHPYTDLFFSPHLKCIDISVPYSWSNSKVPRKILPAITSIISALPTPTLRDLSIEVDCHGIPSGYFKDSLSSVILHCGPSFTVFSPIPLSDGAVNHLIHLPHLRIWHTEHPPPSYSASSLPLVFPPLIQFTLGEGAAQGWLSLFKRLGNCVSSTQDTTPLSRVRESLEFLTIENFPGFTIDVSLVSIIQAFRNLDHLNVGAQCHDEDGNGQCTFKLSNENVTELAIALPQLEYLLLGYVCHKNTCATTIACLLPLSVHCAKLRSLEIHFNTTNILDDLKIISGDPRFQELRFLPKSPLSCLGVRQIPLALDESDFETVAGGMTDIFPYLERCDGSDVVWDGLNKKIAELQGNRGVQRVVCEYDLKFSYRLIHSFPNHRYDSDE